MRKTILSDLDLHLFNEGNHYRAYEKLGSHAATFDGESGLHFAVWAPNADRVSVVGDFNRWDGRVNVCEPLHSSGIWTTFVPGLAWGEKYKYEVRAKNGALVLKADPYARRFEVPPRSATIAWDASGYQWNDQAWIAARAASGHQLERPVSIYEVHLGSWRRGLANEALSYRDLADQLVPYVTEMGYTHVELLPVMEHPFTGSWGYQVTGFFAPTSRFGPPEDFKRFIDACHQAGIGVILDWVPGHFPKDGYGLIRFDGTALYEHEDTRLGEHKEWGTLVFNYGRHEVRNFLLSNALFWLDEYHADGLRVDAVASMLYLDYSRKDGQWLPNRFGGRENLDAIDFLRQLNIVVHEQFPGALMIAEESTAWPAVSRPVYTGGLGFTFKWNMGWMHDMLRYMSKDPVHRKWQHNDITFSMLYAYTENFVLPFSHDEVVHGKRAMVSKMPGDTWQRFANLRALYGYMFGHPGKKLNFMGGEFGQTREWDHDHSLDWHLAVYPEHKGLQQLVRDLNRVYREEPSLHELDVRPEGFSWIDCNDHESSIVSFVRRSKDPADFTLFILNFTPVVRHGYRLGVPEAGWYREVINTDAAAYGGSNVGNQGRVPADAIPTHGYEHSVSLTVPPLACLMLKPDRDRAARAPAEPQAGAPAGAPGEPPAGPREG
ncbi:MAG TPA: 1,4-alpha-glucan branching protein GlgB [Vicinamibacterales bacterium]|nr:1,4-alpha-glucan branching protein GlgB [Vicinamibacterales bacterium]HPK70340.1 1,4-alpha-glucan branching protein GlgB [Vicinamibacterales bacterium]